MLVLHLYLFDPVGEAVVVVPGVAGGWCLVCLNHEGRTFRHMGLRP